MQLTNWTFGKVAAAGAVLGLLVAGYLAVRTPSIYQSTAVLRIKSTATSDPAQSMMNLGRLLNEAEREVLSRSALVKLVMDNDLYGKNRSEKPLEDIVEQMRNQAIQIRVLKDATFTVAFQYPDPVKAQAVNRQFTQNLIAAMPPASGANVEVLDPASLAHSSIMPNRPLILALGVVLGLLLGAVIFGSARWPKVAIAAFATGGAVFVATLFIPNQYMSQAVVRCDSADGLLNLDAAFDSGFLQSVMVKCELYPKERATQPIMGVVNLMRNRALMIRSLEPQSKSAASVHAASIAFQYSDPVKAQAVVRMIVSHALDLSVANPARGKLEVLDPGTLPQRAFEPNRLAWALLGFFIGLLFGTAWHVGGRYRTRALRHA